MPVSIRLACVKDFTVVYTFICELQNKVFNEGLMNKLYLENISNPNNIYLVAEENGLVQGYASCHLQNLLHHCGKIAEIQEMYVNSNYRSKGVGKALMNELKKITKEKGAIQLEVTTRSIREKAIQFYQREAFENSHRKLVHYF